MSKILEPIEEEVEKYTEDDYCDMLNECYGEVKLGSFAWDADYVLRELDPIAYRCGFNDYQEYETVWICPICNEQHHDEWNAKWCCQEELEDEEEL